MEKVYISIGSGCASATLLKQRNLRNQSLPFDWILSHLNFVNDVIESFYNSTIENSLGVFLDLDNDSIFSTFVKEENNDLKYVDDFGNVHDQKFEAYQTITKETQPSGYPIHPYNRKHKVTYPHDSINIDVEKYKTRLDRLKSLLLDPNNFISFVYISPSSINTHYCIDNEPLTLDAKSQLNRLCEFLGTKRDNFEVIFIDSLEESSNLDNRIKRIAVEPYRNWFPMITKNKIEF